MAWVEEYETRLALQRPTQTCASNSAGSMITSEIPRSENLILRDRRQQVFPRRVLVQSTPLRGLFSLRACSVEGRTERRVLFFDISLVTRRRRAGVDEESSGEQETVKGRLGFILFLREKSHEVTALDTS